MSSRIENPWLAVAFWTGAIFMLAPMGPAYSRLLQRALGLGGLHIVLYTLGVLLVVRLLATLLRTRRDAGPRRAAGALACIVGLGCLLWHVRFVEEMVHLLEYCPLGILVYVAIGERVAPGRRLALTVALSFSIGVAEECLQAYIPWRAFDTADILLNLLGISLPLGFYLLTRRAGPDT